MGSRVEAEQAAGRQAGREGVREGEREGGAADTLLARRISMPYSSRGRRSTSSQQSLTSVFAFSHGSGFKEKKVI